MLKWVHISTPTFLKYWSNVTSTFVTERYLHNHLHFIKLQFEILEKKNRRTNFVLQKQ